MRPLTRKDVRASRKPDGHIVITDEWGGVIEGDTHQCCSCGGHFVVVAGSGRRRGWCQRCMRPTCGKPECMRCIPIEQRLENHEKGRDVSYTPIQGAVPSLILP